MCARAMTLPTPLVLVWTLQTDCARHAVLAVRPRRRSALLFYNLQPNGDADLHSKHASCPVLRGEKWSATKWIREAALDPAAIDALAAQQQMRQEKQEPLGTRIVGQAHHSTLHMRRHGHLGHLGRRAGEDAERDASLKATAT